MGSEMCIRDSGTGVAPYMSMLRTDALHRKGNIVVVQGASNSWDCLLYTSDAADERSSVDLGGRRIIKKKTK